MPLINMADMLQHAYRYNYAVGAFGVASRSTLANEAKHYVERTGVACLAVSVSRLESGSTKHDFSRLSKINQAAGTPLGVHGGGALSGDQFRRMISCGASKINYSTPLFEVVAQRIRDNALTPKAGYAEHVKQVRNVICMEVERCILVWGCGGRAAEVLQQCRTWEPCATDVDQTAVSAPELNASNTSPLFARQRLR